ncbi:MAG TPA: beta-ketoacyl synthase N-terminal-like domain-containing protein, partial [Candidatus Limnocylindria bacterium]|nr:beta-ketoacyl synthase N-terminal-like domain-containing protein [Candidatus Limnocylindria bacterium]
MIESFQPGGTPVAEQSVAQLCILSARTSAQLRESAARLQEAVGTGATDLGAIARTLQFGRDGFEHRVAIIAASVAELGERLKGVIAGQVAEGVCVGGPDEASRLKELLVPAQVRELVRSAVASRDLPSLASLWAKGVDGIDWAALHSGSRSRVALPTYPFEARALWYGGESEAGSSAPVLTVPVRELPPVEPRPMAPLPSDGVGLITEYRTRISGLIRELLLLKPEDELRPDRSLFDLGLDSITSVRLVQKLGDFLGLALPETLFLDHPTIERLAEYLAKQASPQPAEPGAGTPVPVPAEKPRTVRDTFKERLQQVIQRHPEAVPLQAEGDGPIVFCIHPMSGDVGFHGKLADASGQAFRMVGLRSRGLSSGQFLLPNIEAMGRFNADLIREIHEGPYFLFGPSMGGAVAYQTARELHARGGRVGGLILLEAPLMASEAQAALWDSDETGNWFMNANFMLITYLHLDPDFRRRKAAGEIRWSELEITAADLNPALTEPVERQLVSAILGRGVRQERDILEQRLAAMARVHLNNLRSLARYRPQPWGSAVDFPVLLLRTRDGLATSDQLFNPDYLVRVQQAYGGMLPLFAEWQRLVPQLEVRFIEGRDHLDLLSTRAAAEQIAGLVREVTSAPVRRMEPPRAPRPVGLSSIAVVGMSGRFPGADSPAEFWKLIQEGRCAFTPLPTDRGWDLDSMASGPAHLRSYVSTGGFLRGVTEFDAEFFGIAAKEAEMMDPSERLFLQEAWKAIEDSGVSPVSLGGRSWGVFCGGGGDYNLLVRDTYGVGPSVTLSSFAGRVAYTLDLKGPVLSIDAGCASSLGAVAQACDQLVLGSCEAALAGGVWINSTPNLIVTGCRTELFSRNGESRALGTDASGMVPGEAVGVLVLKRLVDAQAAGDRIYGVIEGWGGNHNGRTNGMAAPSVTEQSALMQRVHDRFGIDPASIGLVEANSTASRLGDAVEIQALQQALGGKVQRARPVSVGSVENNVGHAFHASGLAHLMKVLLALHHRILPGTPQVGVPNPLLAASSALVVPGVSQPWTPLSRQLRRAAVNSFGATGTNLHLVVAEPAGAESTATSAASAAPGTPVPIRFSAKTREALLTRCRELGHFLTANPVVTLRRLAANLLRRDGGFAWQIALEATDLEHLRTTLAQLATGVIPAGVRLDERRDSSGTGPSSLGKPLNWQTAFDAAERAPLSLPGYPFHGRRYWLDVNRPAAKAIPGSRREVADIPVVEAVEASEVAGLFGRATGITVSASEWDRPFGELGLESMGTMRLVAELNERFQTGLQLHDLAECPTIRQLHQRVVAGRAKSAAAGRTLPTAPPVAVRDAWMAGRLTLAGASLAVASLTPSRGTARRSWTACEPVVARLTGQGIALFHDGTQCHGVASS